MKKDKKKKGCLGCLGSVIGWGLKGLGLILIVGLIASLNKTDAPQQTSPTSAPTAEATQTATVVPVSTPTPTPEPTNTPTATPTAEPTQEPTATPTPTAPPTKEPTAAPTPTATPAPTNTPEPTATPQPTASPEPTPEPLVMPGIGGSNAYDIVLSLVKHGIEKPKTQQIDGGFEWTAGAQIGKTHVSYDVIANADHEVCSATFNMSGTDNGFLWFAATLPYDAADKDAATAFVTEHMTGDPATLVIGDALFAIYPGETNVMLEISDVDSDAYFLAKLDELN